MTRTHSENTEKNGSPIHGIIGQSESFLQVLESIKQAAPTNITILITGESGTGKEIIAGAIHEISTRRDKPLITVNCGAIPEGILESELFGHVKGSFTGAVETRKGYFEAADGGTILLDEIGEMPLAVQVKLLRVLEERSFMRVGGTRTIQVDVRVLAATNKNLERAVQRGEFRKDLFYRLNTVKLEIPPLRKRIEDIPLLAKHFAQQVCTENKIVFQGFTEDALDVLKHYSWPGNIRELRNIMERLIVLEQGRQIDRFMLENHLSSTIESEQHLPVIAHKTSEQVERELIYRALLDLKISVEEIRSLLFSRKNMSSQVPGHETYRPSPRTMEKGKEEIILPLKEIERMQIEKALHRFRGNRRKVARALKIGERTLYRKLKEYGLE